MVYKNLATCIRKRVLKMLYESQSSHLGGNMSCVEILVALYYKIMKPGDHFILSKGHCVATLYAILADKGIISKELLDTYYQKDGLPGHATKMEGIEVSTGSLGHGLPIGIGMALADRSHKVYVLMSDGEMQCGTTWESALFASHHKLDNLIVIVDYNKWQAFGKTNEVLNLEPLAEKWISFGWNATDVDGHNVRYLEANLAAFSAKPLILIAHTIKGKGVSFYEDKLESHYFNLDEKQYKKTICKNLN